MTKQELYLTNTLTELARVNTRNRFIGVKLEQILGTIERKAGRKVDTGQIVIALANLVTDGKVVIETQQKRVGGVDAERQPVQFYRLA